jgi:hypothetical protein
MLDIVGKGGVRFAELPPSKPGDWKGRLVPHLNFQPAWCELVSHDWEFVKVIYFP